MQEEPNPPPDEAAVVVNDDPASPEVLARYDAETGRRACQLNTEVEAARREYDEATSAAKDAKKVWEGAVESLSKFLTERRTGRGQPITKPEAGLFDSWRDLPPSVLKITDDVAKRLAEEGFVKLGDIDAWLQSDGDGFGTGLSEEQINVLKAEVQAAAEGKRTPVVAAADDLWKQYPIERLREFGITDSDVKKLNECVVKTTGEVFPIATMGDLNRFTQPSTSNPGYNRGYGDIKGFGTAATDRLSEAETKFWKAWNSGLEQRFAEERGYGNATPTGVGAGDSQTGGESEDDPDADDKAPTEQQSLAA